MNALFTSEGCWICEYDVALNSRTERRNHGN